MTDRYFDKFPIIDYNGVKSIDIMRRTATLKNIQKNPHVVHPYELSSYERADQFSNRYYGDSFKSWQLYLTNKIVDPYFEWFLQPSEFNEFIRMKYGSIEAAQDKTFFFRNDWAVADDIDVSRYDSLPARLQAYYSPLYGASQRISGYTRKREDWEVNTNEIVQYTVANTAGYIKNEIVDIVFDVNNSGQAQVVSAMNNHLYVQHTSGTTKTSNTVSITGSSYIKGRESASNAAFTAISTVEQNLHDEEVVYYRAVSYWDYETEKNEYNKTIIVLDNRFSQKMVEELAELMKE